MTSAATDTCAAAAAHAFIQRWQHTTASELATAQSFVIDLCELLSVTKPHPTSEQDYIFERPVTFAHGDGSTSAGRIDCYRRGHFVLEAKKQVTRDVAALLAQLAESLEGNGTAPTSANATANANASANFKSNMPPALIQQAHSAPETVAAYLTRCLSACLPKTWSCCPKAPFWAGCKSTATARARYSKCCERHRQNGQAPPVSPA